jgi:hypothetical protein
VGEAVLLLAFQTAVNLPHLASDVLPVHDTLAVYQVFHACHAGLLHEGRLPEWLPYGTYGIASDLPILFNLSPVSQAVMAAGAVLGIDDALTLFKASVLLEQAVFLLGLHLLALALFRSSAARLTVGLGAAAAVNWPGQLWFDFRIVWLLPAATGLLILFLRRRRGAYGWAAGAVIAASMFGNLPYFAPVYLLVTAAFGGTALLRRRDALLPLAERSLANAAMFGLCAALWAGYLLGTAAAVAELAGRSYGRNPDGFGTDLRMFLTYGNHPDPGLLLQMLVTGLPVAGDWSGCPDQTLYVGLLPVCFAAYGLARARRPESAPLLAAGAAVFWLSAGGVFAAAAYSVFPGMALVRHLGALYGIVKLFLLLLAGFGIDHILQRARPRHALLTATAALVLADLYGNERTAASVAFPKLLEAAVRAFSDAGPVELLPLRAVLIAGGMAAASAVWLVQSLRLRGRTDGADAATTSFRWALGAAFVTIQAADVGLFSAIATARFAERFDPASAAEAARAAEPAYQARRGALSGTGRPRVLADLFRAVGARNSTIYQYSYGMTHEEPHRPEHRVQILHKGADRLLRADPPPPRLDEILGCAVPKLRLVRRAVWAADGDQALRLTADLTDADTVVLTGAAEAAAGAPANPAEGGDPEPHFAAFSWNRITVSADVRGPGGAWLVYSDGFHRDWRASVDGRAVPVHEAYGAFKAVRLEPGAHAVEFAFRGHTWRTTPVFCRWSGLLVCAAGSAALAAAYGAVGRARPHRERG